MTECNELLVPVFKEITEKAAEQYALGEDGTEYKGEGKNNHSKEYWDLDQELGELYNQAVKITKHYNSFKAVCDKSDCGHFIISKSKANHCAILQCADFGKSGCPFYKGGTR